MAATLLIDGENFKGKIKEVCAATKQSRPVWHTYDFKTLLSRSQWVEDHQTGSHSIWYSSSGFRLSIQNRNGMAKGYQVKQFLAQLDEEISNE